MRRSSTGVHLGENISDLRGKLLDIGTTYRSGRKSKKASALTYLHSNDAYVFAPRVLECNKISSEYGHQ